VCKCFCCIAAGACPTTCIGCPRPPPGPQPPRGSCRRSDGHLGAGERSNRTSLRRQGKADPEPAGGRPGAADARGCAAWRTIRTPRGPGSDRRTALGGAKPPLAPLCPPPPPKKCVWPARGRPVLFWGARCAAWPVVKAPPKKRKDPCCCRSFILWSCSSACRQRHPWTSLEDVVPGT
jgi:hypothetical protein